MANVDFGVIVGKLGQQVIIKKTSNKRQKQRLHGTKKSPNGFRGFSQYIIKALIQ